MLSEFQKIKAIQRWVPGVGRRKRGGVIVDIGDDAAVLSWKSPEVVVTTDCQVEGTHFSLRYAKPEEVGHRLMACNLSDLAAMGARPRAAVVSLALGPRVGDDFLKQFYKGLGGLGRRHGIAIVGGNLSLVRGPSVLDLTALGDMEGNRPLTRQGARPGDWVAVTGMLGDSAGGLASLMRWRHAARQTWPKLVRAHLKPDPQVRMGRALRGLASSVIDVSDGFSSELHHLAEASQCGFSIDEARLPVSPLLRALAKKMRNDAMNWVFHGGESYGLLFTVPPSRWKRVEERARALRVQVSVVGRVERRHGRSPAVEVALSTGKKRPLAALGWEHF